MESVRSIREARAALSSGTTRPIDLANAALARANGNAGRNTYIWRDPRWTLNEAAHADSRPPGSGGNFGDGRANLWGIPVSAKDCFDLAGTPTSSGVKFYAALNGAAVPDS